MGETGDGAYLEKLKWYPYWKYEYEADLESEGLLDSVFFSPMDAYANVNITSSGAPLFTLESPSNLSLTRLAAPGPLILRQVICFAPLRRAYH